MAGDQISENCFMVMREGELTTSLETGRPPMQDANAVVASPLGNLTLSASDTAIIKLNWTTADVTGTPESEILQDAIHQLSTYFEQPKFSFDLPLAPDGDEFERSVWDQMLKIPSGMTETYGDVGIKLAKPARAVGGACGRNPIPIIIPCHRIVGAGGRMTGYSGAGGIETKRWLLQHEGALLI